MENIGKQEKLSDNTLMEFESINYVSSGTPILNDRKNDNLAPMTKYLSTLSIRSINDMKPTSYLETLTHMIKANIGCGLLATGMAFKNGGLLLSGILIFILGIISTYNQYILVLMATEMKTQYNYRIIGFAETIGIAFESGSLLFKKSASFVKHSISIFVTLTQLGFCCVYLIFISQSLKQICNSYGLSLDDRILMVFIFPIIWATALIRELKYIAPLSTAANLSIFIALGLILYNNVQNLPSISERKLIGNWSQLSLCFGTVIYALEGISLVLPLQQNMRKNKQFLGPFGVLNLSLSFVTLLIFTIGFFGYMKHGDEVRESLTYNLEIKNNIITQLVIFCMVFGILCTYSLQFFVPVRILLPTVKRWSSSWPYQKFHIYEYVLRSVLVFMTFLIAELIPHIDLFVSLIGAIGSTFLALIFSPLADLSRRKKDDFGLFKWRLIINLISILIGLCGFSIGTTISLKEIYAALCKDFKEKNL